MAEINTTYLSPAATREAAASAKPISAKKDFERIIRDIRSIAARTRTSSGSLIDGLIEETNSSATQQRNWSWAGSTAQLGIPVIAALWAAKNGSDPSAAFQMGSKVGDVAQSACGATQFGHQAGAQKIQQSLTLYNTFDHGIQGLIQSIENALQNARQAEDANNR